MRQEDPNHGGPGGSDSPSDANLGLAGRTARFFINSPLSPLLFISMMMMGFLGLVMTPRQEDPQISVPMVDIFVNYPGASADQVANLAIEPLERIMSEIPGTKHVYSASQRGMGMVTIEFDVGEEMGPSLVKVNDKLSTNMDKIPPGVSPPLVKSKGIDDVPVVNITLWSKDMDQDGVADVDDGQLRMLAQDVLQSIKEIPNTGNGFVVGGRAEQVTVEVFPERLSGYGISLDQVAGTIRTANSEQQAGAVESGNTHFTVTTGSFLKTTEDISRLVVGTHNDVPVYLHDVARVTQGPEDASQMVSYYTGPAGSGNQNAAGAPAVTIAVAKKPGVNGVTVADNVIQRVNDIKGTRIPSNVEVSVTRDYGETANDKVNELIFKLFMATGFVFLLVLIAFRALRPAIVVVLVIPVVLLMTIFFAWVTGYTIDRVSLFALIFSIGILVDDAIVVVENIYRRWLEEGKTDEATAVDAVAEVGNPTILATFTVIAALLPMGFVSGMMGPYMEPIPALGSAAMLISLFAAFVFTPWLTISRWFRPTMSYLEVAERREHKESEWLEGFYRKLLTPMIEYPRKRYLFRIVLWGTFALACSMFYTKWVAVKMLPLDNKPEFSVVLDMSEGTALPLTANLAHRMAEKVRQMPEVTAVQVYTGTARPFDFNGMVRHYYMRQDPWQGELQVQLLHKSKRDRSSHEIAVQAREDLTPMARAAGARVSIVEMPPGPPVLQSVVAEVHGPSADIRRQVAGDLTGIFGKAESLRDVDNYMRQPYQYWRFHVDTEKAVRRGISVDTINRNLSMALGGMVLGDVKQRAGHEPVNIVIQVPLAERSQITRLGDLPIQSEAGVTLPLRELGRFEQVSEEPIIYHKDLRGVEYVVAEVGGELAAPVYGMFQVQDLLAADYTAPDGVKLDTWWFGPPPDDTVSSIEWTGEWTVTYETFRDMGGAFMVALVLIYILVVWEFGNFRIPALIMAPIPLTLLGIIPMHAIMGAEFTATSMIGWIALAGIIVRNSILLVDYSVHEVRRGTPVAEAVIRSCKTRTRPIMITALALVAGSSVIFTDPIFQGMAISLASGVMVSTVLTLIVIPLGCIKASKSLCEVAAAGFVPSEAVPTLPEPVVEVAAPQTTASYKMPLLLVIWGKVVSVLLMVFYLVRGIFLLLGQFFKRKKSAPPPPPPRSAPPPTSPPPADTGSSPPGGSTTPASESESTNSSAATSGDEATVEIKQPAGGSAVAGGDKAPVETEQPAGGSTVAGRGESPVESAENERPAGQGRSASVQEKTAVVDTPRPVEKAPILPNENGVEPKPEPSGSQSPAKKVVRKKADSTKSPPKAKVARTVRRKVVPKAAPAKSNTQQQDAPESKSDKPKSTAPVKPKISKKGGRRGIRLRNVGDNGGIE
ncbi:MAG: MMPL family transporter [Gammaproteobacteria bacterium]|nr:MMPL family transporter [Gammaproteobacteria bacterium]